MLQHSLQKKKKYNILPLCQFNKLHSFHLKKKKMGQNIPHGIGSSIRSNGKADMLTTLPSMSDNSEALNANMHGGIGNNGNGINYGINIPDSRNKHQQQSKITSNAIDIDTNGIRRIDIKRKQLDSGLTDDNMKKAKYQSSTLQVAVQVSSMQQNEEKKTEEVTFENVWKKNMQTRRQFMCSNTPTIVVTPIKSKELRSATS
ncbi:hypothetical protein RFI_36024, partial [Reticulomyxa filosa]